MKQKRREWIFDFIFYVCFFLVSFYLIIILLSPLLIQSDNRILVGMGAVSYISNILMCHQLPERSLQLFGQYMPICSRDTGLFLGVLLAFLASFIGSGLPEVASSGVAAVLSVIPLAVDGTMQLLGFWESTNEIRLATGILAGFFISYYIIRVFFGRPKPGREAQRAFLAFSPLLLVFLVVSFYVGSTYQTEAEVLTKTKAINNFTDIKVFYIAPRAFSSSISRDEYLKNYNDTVLSDVLRLGGTSQYGVWVAVASGKGYGRYVFASEGVNYFYDATDGRLIGEFEH